MSCQIYCIEDCNGLRYVGSTIYPLNERLSKHRWDKKTGRNCSSKKLDLDNCKIYQLESCDVSDRCEREKYLINNTECVNLMKYNFDRKSHTKKYREKNKEKRSKQFKDWYEKNKDKNKEEKKKYLKEYHQYKKSWGGSMKEINNNLLKIDVNLFLN